jgi:hypothetical protein
MALSDGTNICQTCQRRFWPDRDGQKYACTYCGQFPEQQRIVRTDWERHPWTKATRRMPAYDDSQCTCPRGA